MCMYTGVIVWECVSPRAAADFQCGQRVTWTKALRCLIPFTSMVSQYPCGSNLQ